MFLVSKNWRGALNIGDMRGFTSKDKAKAYWDTFVQPNGSTMFARAYKLSDKDEPVLLRTEEDWKQA